MQNIIYILKDGSQRSVSAKTGHSVMETAIHNNIAGIDAECGGSCSCATCHVYVASEFLDRIPVPDEMEAELLEGVAAEREAGSRLSCQLIVTPELDGLVVRVPQIQS
jgi:ferredoxin, 2Fe-2S